jgi:3-hydroxyisobutyrate dehydrogenase
MAKETVAVLGTGTIGAPMARNLLKAGFDVRVWNRTREKAEALAGDGATVAGTPAEAVAGAGIVLTALSDGDAVEETMEEDGALAAIDGDAVWIQSSTVGVEAAERFAELAREQGVGYVDAPVLGTKQPAEQGELIVLAAGPERLRGRVEPVFDAVGKKTVWVDEGCGGSRLKLAVNLWLLSITEAAAEAIAFSEALGLDPRLFLGTVEGGPLDMPYLQLKGKAILERSLDPSFKLSLAAKDARLVLEAASGAGVDLALARAVRERMERAVELGHGDEDMAATYFATAPG